MVQRVSYGSCPVCGKALLYMGATYCSPQCNAAAYQQRCCVLCGAAIDLLQQGQTCGACMAVNIQPKCEKCGAPCEDAFLMMCSACKVANDAEFMQLCCLCSRPAKENERVCEECSARFPVVEREPFVLDSETELITEERPNPPIVCTGFANKKSYWIFHANEARAPFEAALNSECLIIGHNIAFDMVCACLQWPDLIAKVFEVYEQDRITDTMLREKLIVIAEGSFIKSFDLTECVRRRLKFELPKGEWQLRFGELKGFPIAQWPEEAKRYVAGDVVSELALYTAQEKERHWLADQFRQARHAFAAEWTSWWGLPTDPESVRAYKKSLVDEYRELARDLVGAGLMRPKRKGDVKFLEQGLDVELVRSVKKVQERVETVYADKGKKAPRTPASRTYPEGQVHADADTCQQSGDSLLKKYADILSVDSMLSNYVPVLEQGTIHPIHAHYDTLLVTGRTSTSPNTQNYPTEQGVRECFAPRPGYVYIIVDYAGIELRTWAQICYGLFGESKLREALNNGMDPHTKMASLILGITYEAAVADYAQDRKGRVYYPRQAGKAGNFGFPGGAGYESWREYARTAYSVDIPKDDPRAPIDAKRVKGFWQEAWPEAGPYHDWINAQVQAGGLMEQAFVKRFRGACRFTEASNTLFQGLAADIAKFAWFLICKACYAQPESPLYGSRPVNFVHDEVVTETPDNERAHEAAKEQEKIMLFAARQFLPDITNIECETMLARRWSKAAKPIFDQNKRLVPWNLKRAA